MSHKSPKIAEWIRQFQGRGMDPHYLGFIECFNQGRFYEAHDVLEELWLGCRREPVGNFYKALIQLAGAFVHLQKQRLRPAAALFRLSAEYLSPFAPVHERLDVLAVLGLIRHWEGLLRQKKFEVNPLDSEPPPRLARVDAPGAMGGSTAKNP